MSPVKKRIQLICGMVTATALLSACGQTSFSSGASSQSKLAEADGGTIAADSGNAESQPGQSIVGRCAYPEFPLPVKSPEGSECHGTMLIGSPASSNRRPDGTSYRFNMYNATNLSHGSHVLEIQNLSGDRYITYQRVRVGANHSARSVDLVLSSYEPVRWIITGNTGTVRSVHVLGYHCATVEGVAPELVSTSTYEQGVSANAASLPLSNNLAAVVSVYEGSCLANREFLAQ